MSPVLLQSVQSMTVIKRHRFKLKLELVIMNPYISRDSTGSVAIVLWHGLRLEILKHRLGALPRQLNLDKAEKQETHRIITKYTSTNN